MEPQKGIRSRLSGARKAFAVVLVALLLCFGFSSALNFDTSKTLYTSIRASCSAYDTISDTLWIQGTNGTGQFLLKVNNFTRSPAYSVFSTTDTGVTGLCAGAAFVDDALLTCHGAQIREYDAMTLQVRRVRHTLATSSGSFRSCRYDATLRRLFALATTPSASPTPSGNVFGFRVNLANSAVWQPYGSDDAFRFDPVCAQPTSRFMTLGNKFGYINCLSGPRVLRFTMDQLSLTLTSNPQLGFSQPISMYYDRTLNRLFMYDAPLSLGYYYDVDEASEVYTIGSIHFSPAANQVSDAGVIVDNFASIAVWNGPSASGTKFYAADLRPTRFGSVFQALSPLPPHPLSTTLMNPATRTSQNFYVNGEQGFAIVVMVDGENRGAVAWLQLSNCTTYSNCSTCLGAGDPWCSWCLEPADGLCRERRTCPDYDYEDSVCPVVSSLSPSTGSVFGQTPLLSLGTALSGTNLRFRFTSIDDSSVIVDSSATTFDLATRIRALGQTPSVPRAGNYSVELIRRATLTSNPQITYSYKEKQNFTFYNCSSATSCGTCFSGPETRSECSWCLYDARCIASRDSCIIPDSPIISPTGTLRQCPQMIQMSPNSSLVPVPSGDTVRISATQLFSSPVTPGFQCVFGFNPTPQIVTATYDSAADQLVCPVPAPPSIAPVDVSLNFRGRPFSVNTLPYVYYLCSLYSSCSDCIQGSKLQCNWCLSTRTCQLSNETCADSEPAKCPSILSLTPSSAFDGESTLVTVQGGRFTVGGTYQCRFGSTIVSATRVSETSITCLAPVQTGFTASFDVELTILRDSAVYTESGATFRYYNCNATSCNGCLGSLQPRCGYCVATGLCGEISSLSGCASSRLSSCPIITAVSPSASTPAGSIPIRVEGEFVGSVSYFCVFSLSSSGSPVNFTVPAYNITSQSIICDAPNVSATVQSTSSAEIRILVEQSDLSLVTYSSNALPFRFVVCSQQTTCSSCILAPQCGWCDLRSCVDLSLANASCPFGVEYNSSYTCPTVDSITPDHSQIDATTPVIVRGQNFIGSSRLLLFCSWGDYFLTQATIINSTALSCDYRIPLGAPTPPLLQPIEVTIKTSTSGLLALSALSFDLYNCTATTNNCTHCATNPSIYCGWCVESYECVDSTGCSASWLAQSCPTISSVSPSIALYTGGSQVTLLGSYYVSSESPSLSLDCSFDSGAQITNGTLQNSSAIVCDVPAVTGPRQSKVSIVQGSSIIQRPFVDNNVDFAFINCSFTRCGECLLTAGCSWCPFDQICSLSSFCSPLHPFATIQSGCPTISSISPASARLAGGIEITITGSLFVNNTNLRCGFGSTLVPATFINSSTLICISPAAPNGTATSSVPFQLILNNSSYVDNSIFNFEFRDPAVPIDQSGQTVTNPLGAGLIVLIVLLILFAIAVAAAIFAFLYIRRKHEDERNAAAWLRLQTPDFPKFAVAVPKDLLYDVSQKDAAKLDALEAFLLRDKDFAIVSALAKVISDRELDSLAKAMTWFFTTHAKSLDMMLHFVNQEINIADSEGTLFRSTSAAAKIFNQYARYVGLPYLWTNLAYYVNLLHEYGKEERKDQRDDILGPGTMEVDPERFEDEPLSEADVRLNQLELLVRASKLLKSILKSPEQLPPEFRILCKQVKSKIASKFATGNNADYKAVGGFLFLRFICPAITTPHVYGLLQEPPNEMSQRYFILIAKLLQSLANEAPPGAKEDYMVRLNEFVVKYLPALHSWADAVVAIDDETQRSQTIPISDELKNQCLAYIAHLLNEYLEQLYTVKDLDKKLYDQLDDLLQNMGAPGKLKEDKKKKPKEKRPLKGKEKDI